jgi:hypothetical protein
MLYVMETTVTKKNRGSKTRYPLCRDVRDYSKLINIGNTNEEEIFTYKYIYFYSYPFYLIRIRIYIQIT